PYTPLFRSLDKSPVTVPRLRGEDVVGDGGPGERVGRAGSEVVFAEGRDGIGVEIGVLPGTLGLAVTGDGKVEPALVRIPHGADEIIEALRRALEIAAIVNAVAVRDGERRDHADLHDHDLLARVEPTATAIEAREEAAVVPIPRVIRPKGHHVVTQIEIGLFSDTLKRTTHS